MLEKQRNYDAVPWGAVLERDVTADSTSSDLPSQLAASVFADQRKGLDILVSDGCGAGQRREEGSSMFSPSLAKGAIRKRW